MIFVSTEKQGVDTEQIARWVCTLNRFKWPDDLPGKPKGFDGMPDFFWVGDPRRRSHASKLIVVNPLILMLRQFISEKEEFRWHHLHILESNNEEFEQWWANRQNPKEGNRG